MHVSCPSYVAFIVNYSNHRASVRCIRCIYRMYECVWCRRDPSKLIPQQQPPLPSTLHMCVCNFARIRSLTVRAWCWVQYSRHVLRNSCGGRRHEQQQQQKARNICWVAMHDNLPHTQIVLTFCNIHKYMYNKSLKIGTFRAAG